MDEKDQHVAVEITPSTEEERSDPPPAPTPPARQQRDRTPDAAVQNFDGSFTNVYGRTVRTQCCTREVLNFAVSAGLIMAVGMTCLILLGVLGFDSTGSEWLKAIISFCIGVFVPNPKLEKKPNATTRADHV